MVPPLRPMLARLTKELPQGERLRYEPKWDGFRCLAFRSGDDVDLRSRNQRPFSRYFPEVVAAVQELSEPRVVLDGELVISSSAAAFDFPALLTRLHPAASRVERLAQETPACLMVFDLIAHGDEDLRDAPFSARRRKLENVMADAPSRLMLTPVSDDPDVAQRWLSEMSGSGIDGVIVKHLDSLYEPGRRTMTKVKTDRALDCVVAGFRTYADAPVVASLLLGLYDDHGALRHVGVASAFSDAVRIELFAELRQHIVPLDEHPWKEGFGLERSPVGKLGGAAGRWTPGLTLDWFPVEPSLVCEVAYDRFDRDRFRHPVRFLRWRPDLEPAECTFEQLPTAAAASLE